MPAEQIKRRTVNGEIEIKERKDQRTSTKEEECVSVWAIKARSLSLMVMTRPAMKWLLHLLLLFVPLDGVVDGVFS